MGTTSPLCYYFPSQPGMWLLSVMRTSVALPPSFNDKRRAMEQQRRRFQQTVSRQEVLVLFAVARQKASHLHKSKFRRDGFMRSIHATAFALCLLTLAPVRSLAGDPQHDVSAA